MGKKFKEHKFDSDQKLASGVVREAADTLDSVYEDWIVDSREKSLAMTKLEESVMWANKAIALHGVNDA